MLNDISLIDKFMDAISGQESSGNPTALNTDVGLHYGLFQIDVNNWAEWARDAGLSPSSLMTPENQYIVARNKMLEYFRMFGNWRDVAISWYGGTDAVSYSEEAKNKIQWSDDRKQAYPTINQYADKIMDRLSNLLGGNKTMLGGGSIPQNTNDALNDLHKFVIDDSKARTEGTLIDTIFRKINTLFEDTKKSLSEGISKLFLLVLGGVLAIYGISLIFRESKEE